MRTHGIYTYLKTLVCWCFIKANFQEKKIPNLSESKRKKRRGIEEEDGDKEERRDLF